MTVGQGYIVIALLALIGHWRDELSSIAEYLKCVANNTGELKD